jgi:hypothetical protein
VTGPRVLGLDVSLNGTGVAGIVNGRCWTTTITPNGRTAHTRVEYILGALADYISGPGLDGEPIWDLACVELPAYSKSTEAATALIGINAHVRHMLWRRSVPYVAVNTAHLKIYATGMGRLPGGDNGKRLVLKAVRDRYTHLMPTPQPGDPPNLETIATFDEADALTLAALGYDHLTGQPLAPAPPSHRRAVGMVPWGKTVQGRAA